MERIVVGAVFKKAIRELFLYVPCHRKPERCYHIKGKPMPICSRCLSILLGYLFIPFLFFVDIPFWVGILLQFPMVLDGYTQLKGWRMSNNFLRTMTGLISGFGLSVGIVEVVRLLISF
ncbi:DUF2085 domain-containing protein [Bacillus sp. M6-12]|uniref:DUF2085 domain-containing protein n=1 Tax=Bacillus sp. M6-12 TaxID=2054166 RepID=UPI0015E0F8F0|nr:DUF2085 domain-containing protein [Bacillus sp. M6-12]